MIDSEDDSLKGWVILGLFIAGLAVAYWITRSGPEPADLAEKNAARNQAMRQLEEMSTEPNGELGQDRLTKQLADGSAAEMGAVPNDEGADDHQ